VSDEDNNSGDGQNGNGQTNTNDSTNNSNGDNAQNAGNVGDNGNADQHGDAAQSQAAYEKRITELDKRDKDMDDKLKRMEALNDKITAEGKATGGQKQKTEDETQKDFLMGKFGDCIDGLDKII